MILIARIPQASVADNLRRRLENAGIQALVREGLAGHGLGHAVEVDAGHFPEAMALLQELDLLSLSPWEAVPCPRCGSLKTERVRAYYHHLPLSLIIMSLFLFGLPLLLLRPRLRCFDCGASWPRPRDN